MYVNNVKLNETETYIGYRVSCILALTISILSSVCKAAAQAHIIPVTQRLRQEEPEFKVKLKVSLGHLVRLVSKLKGKKGELPLRLISVVEHLPSVARP